MSDFKGRQPVHVEVFEGPGSDEAAQNYVDMNRGTGWVRGRETATGMGHTRRVEVQMLWRGQASGSPVQQETRMMPHARPLQDPHHGANGTYTPVERYLLDQVALLRRELDSLKRARGLDIHTGEVRFDRGVSPAPRAWTEY